MAVRADVSDNREVVVSSNRLEAVVSSNREESSLVFSKEGWAGRLVFTETFWQEGHSVKRSRDLGERTCKTMLEWSLDCSLFKVYPFVQ